MSSPQNKASPHVRRLCAGLGSVSGVCVSGTQCYTLIAKFAPISLHITPTRAKTQAVSYPAIPTLGTPGKHECAWIVLGAVLGLLKTPHCSSTGPSIMFTSISSWPLEFSNLDIDIHHFQSPVCLKIANQSIAQLSTMSRGRYQARSHLEQSFWHLTHHHTPPSNFV